MELKVEETRFEKVHIKDGLYNATLKEVKKIDDGQYGARVAVVFDVYTTTVAPSVELSLIAYQQLTPKSKLTKALVPLGAVVEVGKTIDTKNLVGNECRVLVETYDTNDGEKASSIGKVMEPDENTAEFIKTAKNWQSNQPPAAPAPETKPEPEVKQEPVSN